MSTGNLPMNTNKNPTQYKQTEIGEIPSDWKTGYLSSVAKVNKNVIGKDYLNDIIEYIDVSSTMEGQVIETQRLTLENAPSRAKRIIRDEDILISTVRPNLKHFAFINKTKPNLIGSTGYAVITAESINPRFLYYFLTTDDYTNYLSGVADTTTSTYPAFTPDILENSLLPIPPIEEQYQIANILSSLNDKIELNRQTIKTLEEIGKALFKRWFVNFEFPNDDGKPYKSSGGKMVDSELGGIPGGWKVKKLGDFTSIDRGISYKGSYLSDKGQPMLNLGSFDTDGSLKLNTLKYYTGDFKATNTVKAGDIIIANTDMTQNRTILGSACIVPNLFNDCSVLFTHHVYSIRIKENIPSSYLYRLLKLDNFKNKAIGYATGTTVLFLPKGAILDYQIVLPSKIVLDKFDNIYKEVIKKQEFNNYENNILSQIRDSLLPRLMSGKLRVRGGTSDV